MIANCITAARMFGTAVLLFLKPMSMPFYIVYILCGVSDALDGFVARLAKTASVFGAKLDSAADLLFYGVMLCKLMPMLWARLPIWIWYIVGITVVIRIGCYAYFAVCFHRFAAPHSIPNKISGALVFLIPFYLLWKPMTVPLCALCALFTLAAAGHEVHLRAVYK